MAKPQQIGQVNEQKAQPGQQEGYRGAVGQGLNWVVLKPQQVNLPGRAPPVEPQQQDVGQQEQHAAYQLLAEELLQCIVQSVRVGVGPGLQVGGSVDVEAAPEHAPVLPARLLIDGVQLRVLIGAALDGLQMDLHCPGFVAVKEAQRTRSHGKSKSLCGHGCQPALQTGDIKASKGGNADCGFAHDSSSSPSRTQARSRSSSS